MIASLENSRRQAEKDAEETDDVLSRSRKVERRIKRKLPELKNKERTT